MTNATVSPNAIVANSARLDPGVVIEADVVVGERVHLRTGTVLLSGTRVADDARLGPYAVIGGEPMDTAYTGETSFVEIGEHADIREFVTVHRATGEGQRTYIGPRSLLMTYVHISHNAHVAQDVTITTLSQIGGHVQIGKHANLGSGAMIHQHVHIGEYAMVGATSGVNRDVLPFSLVRGNMAKHYRANSIGLKRHGFTTAHIDAIQQALTALRRKDEERFASLALESEHVATLQTFIFESSRGLSGFVGR